MAGFDDPGIFFSDNFAPDGIQSDATINLQGIKKKFKEFIRQFHSGNFNYKYRDTLKRNYNLRQYYLEVNLEDLRSFDETLAEKLCKQPSEHLAVFEDAGTEVADELTHPRPEDEEDINSIQIILSSDSNYISMRELKSEVVSRLIKIPGIIVSASQKKTKAIKMSIQCRSCQTIIPNISTKPGLEGYALPRRCSSMQAGAPSCPLDPFFIMPDKCDCINFQFLKLQELPEGIPQGEIPRHLTLYCDRYLCERVFPGSSVYILGIYSIRKANKVSRKQNREKGNSGVRAPYIRVVGIQVDSDGIGIQSCKSISAEEEDLFRRMAASPNIYDRLSKSIAPSIYGSLNIKKAIACLLFGGSRKKNPDGIIRRGDINVLLLGDPGTAKSQFLKFVERVSPIGVYTSGKGSSAAGLTASVVRDPSSRNFVMEGGAMVLADGGVVCIDEFDKMREDDRVAIHEAMEQQTISIAKAGITTTLNTRCAVLAAANSIFGRWDETKGEDNIDFMPTILSRFDMIFIVKDVHNEQRDITLAHHIIKVHMNGNQLNDDPKNDELQLDLLKKYINYCRTRCGPRLSIEAGEKLKKSYVMMRSGANKHEKESNKKSSIPITVRQLEAIIRISESLAKMQLLPFATETHVNEALRLFQVSTYDAAMSGTLAGVEGFTTDEDHEMLIRIEKQLKRRFAIGTQVSQQTIIQDFVHQNYPETAVVKVIQTMIRRGQLQHRMQRRMLYRLN